MALSPTLVRQRKHMCMRMYSQLAQLVVSGLTASALLLAGPAFALDGNAKSRAESVKPLELFKDPRAALRSGMENYRKGDVANSIVALKYAADGGEQLAQWKLGRMYAKGDGVKKNDLAAYQYFARIIRDFQEDQLRPGERSVVASAFVAVGAYSRTGIPKTGVRRDLQRALHLFHYASTAFGDADAQYNLARMYLDGAGTERNPRRAVPWLRYAARKNHVEAMAVLGNLLYVGDTGVPRRRSVGLMYLTLASELAADSGRKLAWVVNLHRQAIGSANPLDLEMARVELKNHLQRRSLGR
jgi:uncharacterized protein